ncbi:ABC transporter permease [Planctomonas deserti]|uniref:ABC transporter permease n=1 Tax=Planctomonas deserti TaxID=2144185 RepID=UPI000D34E22B|nr:ABC transporter permease [Planctomonas deserti]
MVGYLARRLLSALGILLLISLFTYVIFFLLSPDPAVLICGKTCTPDRIDQIRGTLGLDQPFWVQFWDFLRGFFVGRTYGDGASAVSCPAPCLGFSFQTNRSVTEMIETRLPVSATVALGAAVLWLLAGVGAGLLSAVKQGTWWDRGAMMFALGGISLPNYFVALILQYVLVVQMQILPFPSAVPFGEDPVRWFQSYLMPWLVLAFGYAAVYARLVRANVLDTLGENFLRTARAKGLSGRLILRRHALRPSLTPVVTMFGMDFAGLLGGALITETVFGLNGVGKLAADSIAKNDQPVIMGVTLLAAFFVVIGNVIVDITYTFLDPRVRIATR